MIWEIFLIVKVFRRKMTFFSDRLTLNKRWFVNLHFVLFLVFIIVFWAQTFKPDLQYMEFLLLAVKFFNTL